MQDLTHFALLAAAMRDRSVWDEFEASGEATRAGEELDPFVDAVREFYATDPQVASCDVALLGAATVGVTRDPKRRDQLQRTLDGLAGSEVSVKNAKLAVRGLRKRRVSEELATKLLIPSKDGPEAITALIDEYTGLSIVENPEDLPEWTEGSLVDLLGPPSVPIFPKSLGSAMRGGLRRGHHMIVFARPEMGKTALAMNIACVAASKGCKILYVTNEDPVRDLMMRALVRFTGDPYDVVLGDIPRALEMARGYGSELLTFREMTPGTVAEVDRLARKVRPDLVVVDQLRNLAGGKTENMTQRLDATAQGLRNVAKRNACAVISLTQAGDSARNKAVLDDGDVDNSNTGISAGCDVLIGMGATPAMVDAGERRLTRIKNKLGGAHGYSDVRFDPITLSFRDH